MPDHIRYLETTRFRVAPGAKVQLDKLDPAATDGMGKQEGKAAAEQLNADLEALQELLYADGRHKLLVILQGVDACGKDGTIRSVFEGVNPQGVKVASFKRPTEEELAHDYLWRVHSRLPRSGEIAIFNRSHYEDVLIVRVHDLVPARALAQALRPHPRVRADARRRRHDDRQVLPAHLQGRTDGCGCKSASTTRPSGGSSRATTSPSASCGTSTPRRSKTC